MKGNSSDEALLVRGGRVSKVFADQLRVMALPGELRCPHCQTAVFFTPKSRDGHSACFKHYPSTPQKIKETCDRYKLNPTPGELTDTTSNRSLTFLLKVERPLLHPQSWRLFLRLPFPNTTHGDISITTGNAEQEQFFSLKNLPSEIQIVPTPRCFEIKARTTAARTYLNTLKNKNPIKIESPITLFPVTWSQESTRSERATWSQTYYAIGPRNAKYPATVNPNPLPTNTASQDYYDWSCTQITLPFIEDIETQTWLCENTNLVPQYPRFFTTLAYPPTTSGKEFSEARHAGDTKRYICLVHRATHDPMTKQFLIVSEHPKQQKSLPIADRDFAFVEVICNENTGLTFGIAPTEEQHWPVEAFVRPHEWQEPLGVIFTLNISDMPHQVAMHDPSARNYLRKIREHSAQFLEILGQDIIITIKHRVNGSMHWNSEDHPLRNNQARKNCAKSLTSSLSDPSLDVLIESVGLGYIFIEGMVQKQNRRLTSAWAICAAARCSSHGQQNYIWTRSPDKHPVSGPRSIAILRPRQPH